MRKSLLKTFQMPGQTHTTSCNIIAHDVFYAFGHPVAKCCNMHLGWYWIKFKNGQSFVATFLDVARCCARLASPSQHHTTRSSNVGRYCVEMLLACGRALRKKGFKWSWPSRCCWYEISPVAITGNLLGKGNDRILNRMATTNYIWGVTQANTRFETWLYPPLW